MPTQQLSTSRPQSCAARTTFKVQTSCIYFLLLSLRCQPGNAELLIPIRAGAVPESHSSLEYYLCGVENELESGTTLQLSPGTHTLGEGPFCLLQNVKNITIQGQWDSPTEIRCSDDSQVRRGIAFFNITNLKITDVVITNCGREVPSDLPGYINETYTFLGPRQKVVLIFSHCVDMILDSMTIDKCFGFSAMAINPLGVTVIQNVSITGTNSHALSNCTKPTERLDLFCSGSGAVFVYADTSITQSLVEAEPDASLNTSLLFIDCSFINNTNWLPDFRVARIMSVFGAGFETQPTLLTGASGLAIHIGQMEYFVDVKVINSTLESNRGNIGSMLLLCYNTIRNSKILLDSVIVSNNECVPDQMGAGIFVLVAIFFDFLSSFPQYPDNIYDLVEISHSTISHNFAMFGGGIQLYVTPQNISDLRIIIRDSKFVGNIGRYGSALDSFQFQSSISNRATHILMEDVVASENTYPGASLSQNSPEGAGVFVFSQHYNITVVGTEGKGSFFHNNTVSVFWASRTNVFLHGSISFENNRGFTGGALSLLDNSILFISNNSALSFTKNSALTVGGAIYTITLSTAFDTCAIQFIGDTRITIDREELQLLNVSINFSNNSAMNAGNSIFGSPLFNCFFLPSTAVKHITLPGSNMEELVYEVIFQYPQTVDNRLAELNSPPEKICVCQNRTFVREDCDNDFFHQLDREVIPGQTFVIFLNPVDVTGTPATSFLYAEPINKAVGPVRLGVNQGIQQLTGLSNSCSPVDFTIFTTENSEVHLKLSAVAGGETATILVNITSCPPGFTLSDGLQECVCSDFIEDRLGSSCNLTQYTIARPDNYWVDAQRENGNDIVAYVPTCPINYCKNDVHDIDLTMPDQLCVSGRTGILCGACKDGLSSVFGSAECRRCSNAWLAILLIYAVVGIVMILFSFLLDLTITHGTMIGLIFYASIVGVNANIYFQQGGGRGPLFWFVSWIILEQGFPLCFYDGMTETVKLLLQYIFPTYVVILIVAITKFSQHSKLMQRFVSRFDGTHVLATMLFLIYNKLLRTVIDTNTFTNIVVEDEDEPRIVWFFDGNEDVDNPLVIVLIVSAILVVLFFILPYIVLMTFSKYIQKLVRSTRLNAHIDASLAPYKHEFRFWFGARLMLILVLYIILSNKGTDNPTHTLTLQLGFMIGFVVLQAFLQPFKSVGIAILDMSFIVNLILLTLGTSYTIQQDSTQDNQRKLVEASLSIALITFFGILIYQLARRLYSVPAIKAKTDQLLEKAKNWYDTVTQKVKGKHVEEVKTEGSLAETETDGPATVHLSEPHLLAAGGSTSSHISLQDMVPAPDDNVMPKEHHLSSSQLREPVLDFMDNRHTA